MINYKEIPTGELWELFCRDFLMELGFVIESSPDRGSDNGKDLLVSEFHAGKFSNYHFRWLVSCKHYAVSQKSVTENDEQNIIERLNHFKADGFIGFYSTIASSNLNDRLRALKENNSIRDFKIMDGALIEQRLLQVGFSTLMLRYLPQSHKNIRPVTKIYGSYHPITCKHCGKDLLQNLHTEDYSAIVCFVYNLRNPEMLIEDIYFSCKGICDDYLEERLPESLTTNWEDIQDHAIPAFFLKFVFSLMNSIRSGKYKFTDESYNILKNYILALSQKCLRDTNEREYDRIKDLIALEKYMF